MGRFACLFRRGGLRIRAGRNQARRKESMPDALRHPPNTQRVTIIAQDPSVRLKGHILTAEVDVPAEELIPGPCGYRVNVIDYDATANVLYEPAVLTFDADGKIEDSFFLEKDASAAQKRKRDARLLADPKFHAQNVYAIAMRTLARFEFALGRRVAWGSAGHQIHIAPHAFAEPNAFYSREDRGIFFGYFNGAGGKPVFTCLSHDVVAHETTHAILDGLRGRYLEPSSPDQAAFHEGFADVVALLSVFSLPKIVESLLDIETDGDRLIDEKHLTPERLKDGGLFGLAEQFGIATGIRGDALRRSIKLKPGLPYMSMPGFDEEHERGELLVAAFMSAFLRIWMTRVERVGFIQGKKRDRSIVRDEGARVADHLLTMAIRAIDYCPPTDLTFADYLSALLTVDREVVPDDAKYDYRGALLKSFEDFDIRPAAATDSEGNWRRCDEDFVLSRVRFDSMLRDPHEVFRFVWENQKKLKLTDEKGVVKGYVEVQSVRPCIRIGPDGFVLRETVAEYIQILSLEVREVEPLLKFAPPKEMLLEIPWKTVRVYGGGALIFDEYGRLKYQIANHLDNSEDDRKRQKARLKHLWEGGYYDRPDEEQSRFSQIHLARAAF